MSDKLLPLVPGDDAVPRVQDVVIGERLGLARPTNVRQTIEANMGELSAFGTLHAENATSAMPNGGTKSVTEYHLNEEQALLVCALSRTAKAAEVRRDLILTYTAYRRGQLGGAIDPRQMGGIIKAVVGKQIKEAITELAPQIIAAQLSADPRVAVVAAIPALQIAMDADVPKKGRRIVVQAISRDLSRFCETKGIVPGRDTRRTKQFPVDVVYAWHASGGKALIRKAAADVQAQGSDIGPLFAVVPGGKSS